MKYINLLRAAAETATDSSTWVEAAVTACNLHGSACSSTSLQDLKKAKQLSSITVKTYGPPIPTCPVCKVATLHNTSAHHPTLAAPAPAPAELHRRPKRRKK